MANVCIPKHLVEKLKDSALKGEVNIKELYDMSSAERREFFTKHTDDELGKFINTEFEKAMVSKQKTAMTDWAKSVFTPKAREKADFKSVLDKINNLDEMGVLNPKSEKAFLEDLVSDKLGISVSPQEVREISKKASKIDLAQAKLGDDLGSPTKAQENIDFFKAKKEMDDYLQGLSPSSKLKIATGTIGRGMMLFSAKSPLLNIGSNMEVGTTEAIVRRLSGRQLRGADNNAAREYIKFANKLYQKTGYDISRMTSLADTGASGGRVLGDTVHAQGSGAVRKVGQGVEDVVFKQLMGAPDVAFSSAHFADSVNLNALKMAKGDKTAAKEIMQDAMRLTPQTAQGEILKAQGVLDAQMATWTNKSWASKVSEGIRKILNDVSGDYRLGDFVLPFVKTPANVISTGLDYAGLGIPKALGKTIKAVKTGNLKNQEYIQSMSRDLVRSGLGITGAVAIASQIPAENFVGAYDPNRTQIEQLKNSNYNAIKIGDKWISTDWFGPLAVPLTGMMYAKKYGDDLKSSAFQYGKGLALATTQLPGISDIADLYTRVQKKGQTAEELQEDLKNYAISETWSRLVPSVLGDIAKGTDEFERKADKGLEGVYAKIPGLRQKLPIKKNVFGDDMKTEGLPSTILFGSRVKSDKSSEITNEIDKVSKSTGKNISFTDWDRSTGKELQEFKAKVGEEQYQKAKVEYGQELKSKLGALINDPQYKNASEEDKLKNITDRDSKAMDDIYARYGFKFSRPKSTSVKIR